jgi:hypothetical protein
MNDTYFNTSTYNKPAWRAMVMCQEIGHIFGLGHQNEGFYHLNRGTCMDYTDDPARNDGAGDNQHPNAHDYDMLEEIYAHLDAAASAQKNFFNFGFGRTNVTVPSLALDINVELSDDPKNWGKEISRSVNGRASVFAKKVGNEEVLTHVFWAEPQEGEHDHE